MCACVLSVRHQPYCEDTKQCSTITKVPGHDIIISNTQCLPTHLPLHSILLYYLNSAHFMKYLISYLWAETEPPAGRRAPTHTSLGVDLIEHCGSGFRVEPGVTEVTEVQPGPISLRPPQSPLIHQKNRVNVDLLPSPRPAPAPPKPWSTHDHRHILHTHISHIDFVQHSVSQ